MPNVTANLPSPDNYAKWENWGKAVIRSLSTIFQYTEIIPDVGIIGSFPSAIDMSKNGWLICNGATFSQQAYPTLFQLLGTATLPTYTSPFPGCNVWIKAA